MNDILDQLIYLSLPELIQLQGILNNKIKIKREINKLAAKLQAAK